MSSFSLSFNQLPEKKHVRFHPFQVLMLLEDLYHEQLQGDVKLGCKKVTQPQTWTAKEKVSKNTIGDINVMGL